MPCNVIWYIANCASTLETALLWKFLSDYSLSEALCLRGKIVLLIRFRSQCFISKHCQTKYNANRDKVTSLRRIKHNLQMKIRQRKRLQSSHFRHNWRDLKYNPWEWESNHWTQCMIGLEEWQVQSSLKHLLSE